VIAKKVNSHVNCTCYTILRVIYATYMMNCVGPARKY